MWNKSSFPSLCFIQRQCRLGTWHTHKQTNTQSATMNHKTQTEHMFTDQLQSNKFRKTKIGNCKWHLVLSDKRNGILRAMVRKVMVELAGTVCGIDNGCGIIQKQKRTKKSDCLAWKRIIESWFFFRFNPQKKNHSRPAFATHTHQTHTYVHKPYGQKPLL